MYVYYSFTVVETKVVFWTYQVTEIIQESKYVHYIAINYKFYVNNTYRERERDRRIYNRKQKEGNVKIIRWEKGEERERVNE